MVSDPVFNVSILGLGNILLQDEGVGVHIANKLKQKFTFLPNVEIIDGGTMGMDLLPYIDGKDKVMIIDAVNFDKEAGYLEVIENNEILKQISTRLSSHQAGLADVLSAAKLLDMDQAEMVLIGIQPASMKIGLEVTNKVSAVVGQAIDLILSRLKEWNITPLSK
jgi:hydrogenase maturation protease|tara:strand:+ start:593 stop:1087 length:495 start_codon:yes stop_codon:yes gene_type:complete